MRSSVRTMTVVCDHLDQIRVMATDETACPECTAQGDRWVHLRLCLTCGHVGCCDSSKNKHATAHFNETGHPIIQSFEPGEDWFWDYRVEAFVDGPRLADPQSHPAEQRVPGPAERVPADWVALLEQQRG